jgi:hypothetical protein
MHDQSPSNGTVCSIAREDSRRDRFRGRERGVRTGVHRPTIRRGPPEGRVGSRLSGRRASLEPWPKATRSRTWPSTCGPTSWSAGRWAWCPRSIANAWAPSAWPAASSRPRSGTRATDGEPTPFRAIAGGFTAVEAEFIIRLGKDAPADKTQWTAEEAAEYVGELIVGIEIAGSPLATINQLGPPIVASDFGNNDGQILGPVIENWRDIAWEDMPAETFINGVSVGKGGAATIPARPWRPWPSCWATSPRAAAAEEGHARHHRRQHRHSRHCRRRQLPRRLRPVRKRRLRRRGPA